MALIQPKPYIEKMKLRHHSYGTERRRNMSKMILENGTPFPKPIEYSDIDDAMFEWVDKKLNLVYDGKKLPTFKLFSIQRINEYMQQWNAVDDANNPILNFKTITREVNPQKGENQGPYLNIPGHRDFAMFYVPVMQENGTDAYDKYTMKQPFAVNFIYTVSIVTNKMEIVNKMNELMIYEFNAIDAYIAPNDHPMSMTLEDVSDNSEYAIDDRKFYLQSYKIKVRGYIIRKEDYKIERIPSRMLLPWKDSDASGIINRRGKNRHEDEKVQFMTYSSQDSYDFKLDAMKKDERCSAPPMLPVEKPSEIYEEDPTINDCCSEDPPRFAKVKVKILIQFDCVLEMSFDIDKNIILDTIETENVYDFKIFVNNELMNVENEIKFLKGDTIMVRISREDLHKESTVALIGFDDDSALDNNYNAEVSIDEPYSEEHIIIQNETDETEKN